MRFALLGLLALGVAFVLLPANAHQDLSALPPQLPLLTKVGEVFVIDDFDNDVTQTDLGSNYFTGNTGAMESAEGITTIWSVLVDDFVPQPVQEEPFLSFNRLGGSRGQVDDPNGSGVVDWEEGVVTATITEGTDTQLGVWTSLNHRIDENLALNFSAIFPPQIALEHQGQVTGLLIRILDGQGTFKAELQAPDVSFPWSESVPLDGGQQEIQFDLPDDPPLGEIRNLNWVVVGGAGDFVAVDRVELIVELPAPATTKRAFLWSYAMLLSNWDPASGLTRDSAKWRADVDDRENVSASGAQAAAATLASDLGLISKPDAVEIVTNTAAGLMALPRCHGLWPHWVQGGQKFPEEEEEWSSIDTIFAIVALLEAQQALGIETAAMEQVLKDIDWAGLILPDGSISHGYNHDCSERLEAGWKDFGTESWLVNLGYASATGDFAEFDHEGPTYNGSGFIDELAWLLVPPPDRDRWGTEWKAYSQEAANKQLGYYTDPDHYHACYDQLELFGLSAAEVPDPSILDPDDDVYQPFGVGGTELKPPNDGTDLLGHAVIVPHYAGMIASLRPDEASALWNWMEVTSILTPLNNVESLMFIDEPAACEEVVWNGLKGSWNLGLQTLGWGRLLTGSDNPLYTGMLANDILSGGYSRMSPTPPPPPDSDGDGFTDAQETFMGTDPQAACAGTATADDEGPPDAWPVDANDDQFVSLFDVLPMKQHFNTTSPDPDYNPRFDLKDQNGTINLFDVLPYKAFFLTSCAP
jgi:hypothetical protein